jgi:hypothetical protein
MFKKIFAQVILNLARVCALLTGFVILVGFIFFAGSVDLTFSVMIELLAALTSLYIALIPLKFARQKIIEFTIHIVFGISMLSLLDNLQGYFLSKWDIETFLLAIQNSGAVMVIYCCHFYLRKMDK